MAASNEETYIGSLTLAGARTRKTVLLVLGMRSSLPRTSRRSIFIQKLDLHLGTDESLVEAMREYDLEVVGCDVPLSLPVCASCQLTCPGTERCRVAAVKELRRYAATEGLKTAHPYTQRLLDLQMRVLVRDLVPTPLQFEWDDTLGGSRAPLAARGAFLSRQGLPLVETVPRLSVLQWGIEHQIPFRWLRNTRDLERGREAREHLLEAFFETEAGSHGQHLNALSWDWVISTQERRRLAQHLGAWDAWWSAWTVLQAHRKV